MWIIQQVFLNNHDIPKVCKKCLCGKWNVWRGVGLTDISLDFIGLVKVSRAIIMNLLYQMNDVQYCCNSALDLSQTQGTV